LVADVCISYQQECLNTTQVKKRRNKFLVLAVVRNREIFGDPWYGILVFDVRGVSAEETNIRSVGVICIF